MITGYRTYISSPPTRTKEKPRKLTLKKAKLLKLRPDVSIADFKALRLSDNPAFLQQTETHLFANLRKAGIPEK